MEDETIKVYDNDFGFEKKGYSYKLWNTFIQKKSIYEKMAMELMRSHYAFYKQFIESEDEYIQRGAKLQCTHGNRYTYLDNDKDYGVYFCNKAVMTCQDNKINKNVYGFALCGNKDFEPTYSNENLPNGEKGIDLCGYERYKCVPVLLNNWGYEIAEKTNKVYISAEETDLAKSELPLNQKCNSVLTTKNTLICLYGGLISIVENSNIDSGSEIEKEDEPLITLEQLDNFGFYMGKNEDERNSGIKELNRVLVKYEINTKARVAFFMGQVAKESNKGIRTLETFNGNDPKKYFNKKYNGIVGNRNIDDGQMFRGAGYLHLTGRENYKMFKEFIGDAAILYRGYQVVGGVYNKPIKDIVDGEIGVINVGQYAWESAGWFWAYGNPDTNVGSLNEYVDLIDCDAISAAVNKNDTTTFAERKDFTIEMCKILKVENKVIKELEGK